MPSQDKLQQFNLAHFYGSLFSPCNNALLEAFESANPLTIDYAICAFFESYWWLSVGVELDYFPEREASMILARHLVDRRAYREFLDRNPNLFPGELVTSLDAALTAKRFFEPVDNYFFYSPRVLH